MKCLTAAGQGALHMHSMTLLTKPPLQRSRPPGCPRPGGLSYPAEGNVVREDILSGAPRSRGLPGWDDSLCVQPVELGKCLVNGACLAALT
jgi:hypothetical protein